jgi:hypothetical protein
MKPSWCVAGVAGMCLTFTMAARSFADDEGVARQIALNIVKNQAVKFLKDWKCEFNESGFEGKAQAVDPEKHAKVSIREFSLFPGYVVLSIRLEGRFSASGKMKKDDQTVAFKVEADATGTISLRADYRTENDEIVVQPRARSVEVEVKLLEIEPRDLPGGKQGLLSILEPVLRNRRDKMVKEINDWCDAHKIGNK